MSRWIRASALGIALVVATLYLLHHPGEQSVDSRIVPPDSDAQSTPAAAASAVTAPAAPPVPAQSPAAPASSVAAAPALPEAAAITPEPTPSEIPPEASLASLRTTVREYGRMFGGNPVGTNPEITRALSGDNPRHINFLKADGNRVNEKGELVDPWGTPYFFHQLSATVMEIHSAGPDRKMWTADDLVTK